MGNKLTIVGLGPGDESYLTLGAIEAMRRGDIVIVRTMEHDAIPYLKEQGIRLESLDNFYNTKKNFDQVYESMVEYVIERLEQGNVVLALPGDPMVGERLSWELLKEVDRSQLYVEIIPGVGRSNLALSMANASAMDGFKVIAARH